MVFYKKMKQINLKNKIICIIGGTGTLGTALVYRLLQNQEVKEIRIFSRDEFKQSEMARKIKDERILYWLGDIRNLERLKEVCENIDIIFHVAAMKRMDQFSQNIFEISDVNIRGTHNVMLAGKKCKKVIFVSTDKAYQPENVYGASKFIAENIVLSYSNGIVWRFGNFFYSRGSVWDIFKEQKEHGIPFTITDINATRFVMNIDEVCDYLLMDVKSGSYRPKNLKSMTIKEIADSIELNYPYKIIGLRDGEKLHESFDKNYTSKK